MRDYAYYLDKAKKEQGFQYDNQVDDALGFKGSMTTLIRKGKRHLSDEKMVELARLANIDPLVALIDLNFLRSDGEAKKSYKKLTPIIEKALLTCLMTMVFTALPSVAEASERIEVISADGGSLAIAALYIIT